MILSNFVGYIERGNFRSFFAISSALFDWRSDFVAPFGPGTVVVSDVVQPEEVGQNEPGVTGTLSDAAVNNRIHVRVHAGLLEIDFGQISCGLKGRVLVRGCLPRNALSPGDVSAAQDTFLRILGHVSHVAFELSR